MGTDIQEMVLQKDSVQRAQFFNYRKDGYMTKYAVLTLDDGDQLKIGTKYVSALLKYIGVTQNSLLREQDFTARDEAFLKAIKSCETEILISYFADNGSVVRVVSSDFTPILHSELVQIINGLLPNISPNVEYIPGVGMFAIWTLAEVPSELVELNDMVKWQIWAYNRNDGQHGLRIGGGYTTLKSNSGAVDWKSASSVRLIHRGSAVELREKIKMSISNIITKYMLSIAEDIKSSKNIPVDRELVSKTLSKFPIWLQRQIRNEFTLKPQTLWEFSNAISYVASHNGEVTFNQKLDLQSLSVAVLRLRSDLQPSLTVMEG